MRPAKVQAAGLKTASEMDDRFQVGHKRPRRASQASPHAQPQPEPQPSPPPPLAAAWSPVLNDLPDDLNLGLMPLGDDHSLADQFFAPQDDEALHFPPPQTDGSAHIAAVEALTTLNLHLLRHASTVPPLAALPPDVSQDDELFNLDDTFRLTKTMLDVVQTLHPSSSVSLSGPDAVAIDTATLFLVISCWLRLADIYDTIFGHIRRCAQQSVLPATSSGKPVSLPPVRIGTFVTDPTTAILLQMLATLQHATQLADGMCSFATSVECHATQSTALVPSSGADETTCRDVKRRAGGMHQQVRAIRGTLMRAGLF